MQDFGNERWETIDNTYRRWWSGQLGRPLIQVELTGCCPGRNEPELPRHPFASFYDMSVSPQAIVDRWDYDLSCSRFLGDGFPVVWPNFGPGVMAAFWGAKLENGTNTVWFHPHQTLEIEEIGFKYNPDNIWLNRILDIYRAAIERWQGSVQLGMTDLGGNLDVLSTFRFGDRLLMSLCDSPEEVEHLVWQIHELWFKYYELINQSLQPTNPGYSAWAGIFS